MRSKLARLYFRGEIPNGFSALFAAKTLNAIAGGLLGIFLPIFLYNLFDGNFQLTMLWYLWGNVLYVLLTPYGAQLLSIIGFKRSLQISSFVGSFFYVCFYFVDSSNVWYLAPLSMFALAIWRITYWLPYHVKFIELSGKNDRGKQLSVIMAMTSFLSIVSPVIAALVITHYSYDILFLVAIALFALSSIPYQLIPRTHERFSWSYGKTWKRMFARKNRTLLIPMMALGAENVLGVYVWPIFIFELLKGNYLEVGMLSTFITLFTIILQLFLGKKIDGKGEKDTLIRSGSILYAIGWFVKIFVETAFHVFVSGVYHSVTQVFTRTPLDALCYEMAADQGHYVDEFTVLRDMSIASGRILMVTVIIIASLYIPIQWTFIFAALSTLLFNVLYSDEIHIGEKHS